MRNPRPRFSLHRVIPSISQLPAKAAFMKSFVAMVGMFCLIVPAFAIEVKGVEFPDKMSVNGQQLTYNGGSERLRFGFQMYVAALYLVQKSSDAAGVVAADETMNIRLQITSGMITPAKMKEAVMEAFEKSTNGNTAPLRIKIDAFVDVFKNLRKKDVYDFAYVPGKGVEASKNGATSGIIGGLDFKKALYGIWLGDKPVQDSLKAGMLGK